MWKLKLKRRLKQPNLTDASPDALTCARQHGDTLYMGLANGVVEVMQSKPVLESGREWVTNYGFQAHRREFDYLESSDILEGIVCIEPIQDGGLGCVFATGNERTVKLWRSRTTEPTKNILEKNKASEESKYPTPVNYIYTQKLIKELKNIHSYTLNSIQNQNEYLITADYLKISLWNVTRLDVSHTLVDIKPMRYEDLTHVITAARFHPTNPALLAYSTSRGDVTISDHRARINPSTVLVLRSPGVSEYELVRSVSDFRFCNENTVVTRDLVSLSLFDVRRPEAPIKTVELFKEIDKIVDTNSIYEKFLVDTWGTQVVTGNFGGRFHVWDILSDTLQDIKLEESPIEKRVRMVAMGENGLVIGYENYAFFYDFVN
ncbi:Protein phosphatase PP2A regulatory subunit B [Astathelohania contejeani]|uniref:Protein phosphatase PP2A regulatory subunit B n=1 Tax=Astathelohania contejeani TaxID=164912 RepID=A0ABQ7I2C7_9MICR|nr:Protein phosphatase PP2A regulatory subunit B [Thelohania contejeani]